MSELSLGLTNIWEILNSQELLHIVLNDRFLLIFFVVMLSSFKRFSYSNMYIAALINIPGTILHELAHFIVGFILNAKPIAFSLWPQKVDNHYVTGSVRFRNAQFYNRLPASMAPLLLLVIAYYFDGFFFTQVHITIWNYLAYILLQTIFIENAIPSPADFRVGFGSILGDVLYFSIFLLCICLL